MGAHVLLITKTWLGHVAEADRAFGAAMLDKFLHTLEASPEKPAAICFYTEGVKLVASGSPVLLSLKVLADAGVRLLVCQSCLQRRPGEPVPTRLTPGANRRVCSSKSLVWAEVRHAGNRPVRRR